MFLIIASCIFHLPLWVIVIGLLQMAINTLAWLLMYSCVVENKDTRTIVLRTHGMVQTILPVCKALLEWADGVAVATDNKTEEVKEDAGTNLEIPDE
jgi:uncharacterized membrane protein YvlD (DUF360 family)